MIRKKKGQKLVNLVDKVLFYFFLFRVKFGDPFFFFFLIPEVVGRWSYFVGKVLGGVRDIILLCCPLVLLCLNLGCRGIFEKHKSLVQKRGFYEKFF